MFNAFMGDVRFQDRCGAAGIAERMTCCHNDLTLSVLIRSAPELLVITMQRRRRQYATRQRATSAERRTPNDDDAETDNIVSEVN